MTENLPGKTTWETREYLRDQGHRVAAIHAYRYLASRLETDESFTLPADADAVIQHAADAMQKLDALRAEIAKANAAMPAASAA